jgi:hypothetical protein
MTLICADGAIGEGQPAALTTADHDLDRVADEPACRTRVAKFTRALQVFPSNLEGFLKQLRKGDAHGWKTNSSRARSISSALRQALVAFDRHGLGAKDHVAENVGLA